MTFEQLKNSLRNLLTDKDGVPRRDEEFVLVSKLQIYGLLYSEASLRESVLSKLKQRNPYPFKGIGAALHVSEVKELLDDNRW